MIEYQIIVHKTLGGIMFYTLQIRKIYFLLKGRWKNVKPENQPTYQDAIVLLPEGNCTTG